MAQQKQKKRGFYRVFYARLSEENHDWLKHENTKYNSWNVLFDELRKRYVSMPKVSGKQLEDRKEK